LVSVGGPLIGTWLWLGLFVTWVPAAGADRDRSVTLGEEAAMATEFDVWCGLDVGKLSHHACALDQQGQRLFDGPLPQDEERLRELFGQLVRRGRVLVVVDQPNTIGALPVAVAQAMGTTVAYLPGLVMRRAADLHPGEAKTDARDAWVIADTARVMPHVLRQVDLGEETLAELGVLVGFDDDLAAESTRVTNRLRGLLGQIHPALERLLGPRIDTKAVLAVLHRHGGPQGLAAAGRGRLLRTARAANPRGAEKLVDQILAALAEQTVTVPGAAAAETVVPRLAQSLRILLDQRAELARQVEQVLDAHPLAAVLTSMPGIGVRTAARILIEVGDASSFPSAAHLAAYAGLAPASRQSGHSIRGEHAPRGGNRRLKSALFFSGFSVLRSDPHSRAYYDRKRAEGKRHNAALLCLARRRCDVIYAMLKHQSPYQPRLPQAA
jgi:transposase